MKTKAGILVLMLVLARAANAGPVIVADDYNSPDAGSGFGLGEGLNSAIVPPATRLTGAAAPNLRYLSTAGKNATAFRIKDQKAQITSAAFPGRFTLSADGTTPFNFAGPLGATRATAQDPAVYEVRITMANRSRGSQRFSFALATDAVSAEGWSFGLQLYRAPAGEGRYEVGKRIESGSSGLWQALNTRITSTAAHTYGAEIHFVLRVVDAGDENAAFNSRVQLSMDGGATWIYDTQRDPDLPNGWRFHGAGRVFVWDAAGDAGPVTYDDFSVTAFPAARDVSIKGAEAPSAKLTPGEAESSVLPTPVTHEDLTAGYEALVAGPDLASSANPKFMVSLWQASDSTLVNTVDDLRQSRDGYLWLSTERGLVRFDGQRFQPMPLPTADATLNAHAGPIEVDDQGRLWFVAHHVGIGCFDGGTLVAALTNQSLPVTRAETLCSDGNGGLLWVDENGRCGRISAQSPYATQRLEAVTTPEGRWVRDYDGQLWIVSPAGMKFFDGNGWNEVNLTGVGTLVAAPRRAGGMWYARNGKLRYVVPGDTPQEAADFSWRGLSRVTCMMEDSQKRLWVGTASRGLFCFSAGKSLQVVPVANSITCLLEDEQRDIWAGTRGSGLIGVRSRHFFVEELGHSLEPGFVRSVAQDRAGRVWAAAANGELGRWDDDGWHTMGADDGWPGLPVKCICPAREGGIWISTSSAGLWRWKDDQFSRYEPVQLAPNNPATELLEDRNDRLWMVTENAGVFCLAAGVMKQYAIRDGLPSMNIRRIVENETGELWVADWEGGIARYREDRWELVCKPSNFANAIQSMIAARGALWLGTSAGGLLCVKEGLISPSVVAPAALGGSIHQLLLDRQGALWGATSHRLFQIPAGELDAVVNGQRKQVQVITYGRRDGVPDALFANLGSPGCRRMADGELWFTTAKGSLHFQPDNLPETKPSNALIDQVLLNGKPIPAAALSQLRPTPGRLEFRFTAPCLTAPDRIHFRYQLDGVDPDWVEAGRTRSASYAGLPIGPHTFRALAFDSEGRWSSSPALIKFTVSPYFWQTSWFLAVVVAALTASTVWGIKRVHDRKLERQLEQLRQQQVVDRERARIAQDVHDELGANLTSIGLLADMGVRHQADPPALSRDLEQIQQTARESVAAMDVIVWALNPRNDSLDQCASYVAQFTREFFGRTPLRTRLILPPDLPARPMNAEMRHQLLLLLKESFNNIIRHAEASEVQVELKADGHRLFLSIRDNGKGFTGPVRNGSQDGLGNLQTRIANLGGTLHIESSPGQGTRLDFALPLTCLERN